MTSLISWRQRAGTLFDCEKTPATARRGMAVTIARRYPTALLDLVEEPLNSIASAI